MDLLNEKMQEGEEITKAFKHSSFGRIKKYLITHIIYLILWIALIAGSLFFLQKAIEASKDFWFIIIPPIGMVIIRLWTLILQIIKEISQDKEHGYVLTNLAFYEIYVGKYKSVKRIDLNEVTKIEKSEYVGDGFYIATQKDFIKVRDINGEEELFVKLCNLTIQKK